MTQPVVIAEFVQALTTNGVLFFSKKNCEDAILWKKNAYQLLAVGASTQLTMAEPAEPPQDVLVILIPPGGLVGAI